MFVIKHSTYFSSVLVCILIFRISKKCGGISENDLAVQITLKINSRHDGLTRNSFLALNLTLQAESRSINRFLQVCALRQTYGFPTVFHNLPGICFSKEHFHLCHSRMHAKPVESGIPFVHSGILRLLRGPARGLTLTPFAQCSWRFSLSPGII